MLRSVVKFPVIVSKACAVAIGSDGGGGTVVVHLPVSVVLILAEMHGVADVTGSESKSKSVAVSMTVSVADSVSFAVSVSASAGKVLTL